MTENRRWILIADDEQKMLRALKDYFTAVGFRVTTAKDGREALDLFYENRNGIDLLLLDVMMPEMDGFSVLKELRKDSCLIPVILLTAMGAERNQIDGFSYGADDYVTKPFSPSILLARVEAVLRRYGKSERGEVKAGKLTLSVTERSAAIEEERIELTNREFELLYYLMVNRSITFTREQLLNHVWGFDFEGSDRTVDTHIRQLRGKLGPCAGYIRTVHCVGYRLEVSDET